MVALFFLLLLQTPVSQEAAPTFLQYLEQQVAVAKKGKVYVTLHDDRVAVQIRGMELKSLPVSAVDRLGVEGSSYSVIRSISPITTFTPAVKYVDKIMADRGGTVESEDEIISVAEMPHTYLIVLEDETKIWIEGDGELSFVAGAKARFLELKSDLEHYVAGIRDRREPVLHLSMTAEAARELFWVAKVGTTVFIPEAAEAE